MKYVCFRGTLTDEEIALEYFRKLCQVPEGVWQVIKEPNTKESYLYLWDQTKDSLEKIRIATELEKAVDYILRNWKALPTRLGKNLK